MTGEGYRSLMEGTGVVTGAVGKFSGGAEFDASTAVSGGTIDLGADNGLKTGDKVTYSHGIGGTNISGLTDGKTYQLLDVPPNFSTAAPAFVYANPGPEFGLCFAKTARVKAFSTQRWTARHRRRKAGPSR